MNDNADLQAEANAALSHVAQLAAYGNLKALYGPDYLTWPIEAIDASGLRVNRDKFLAAQAARRAAE